MFYVFVISRPVELKLDSELEDISIGKKTKKKKKKKKKKHTQKKNTRTHKYSVECLCICRVFHEVKLRGHPSSIIRDLRCLTLWKSHTLQRNTNEQSTNRKRDRKNWPITKCFFKTDTVGFLIILVEH